MSDDHRLAKIVRQFAVTINKRFNSLILHDNKTIKQQRHFCILGGALRFVIEIRVFLMESGALQPMPTWHCRATRDFELFAWRLSSDPAAFPFVIESFRRETALFQFDSIERLPNVQVASGTLNSENYHCH